MTPAGSAPEPEVQADGGAGAGRAQLDQVADLGNGRSHWVGKCPLGLKVEWDAEIADEQEGRRISWRSLPGSQVHNAGTVWFDDSPSGRRDAAVLATLFVGGLRRAEASAA